MATSRRRQLPDGIRYTREGARPMAGGLNDSRHPLLITPGQSGDALNVEFDRESVAVTGGAIKIGNQVAPRSALLCPGGGAENKLEVLPGKSAPTRGAIFAPWSPRQDIGAELALELHAQGPDPDLPVFHTQRGKNFDLTGTFQIPAEERLFKGGEKGQLSNFTDASFDTTLGAEIALDEFTCLIQKGGSGMTPMSWALGIVNVGNIPDIDSDGAGNNLLGVPTSQYADRKSNYALCFLWLDAPKVGVTYPVQMRYHLTDGQQVFSDDDPVGHVAATDGAYCTMAYRAIVIPKFVLPGRAYDVSFALSMDTGNPGTGDEPTVDWNGDANIRCVVNEQDFGFVETFEYKQSSPSTSTIYRWKGPADSLEYFGKYGIRWHGKDATWLGLGYRYAPWCAAGFIPFGIDSAPVERGGFQLIDQSVHTALAYGEGTNPETSDAAAGGPQYFLRIAHDAVADPTGVLLEVSDQGLVQSPAYAAVTWGEDTGAWVGIASAGRSPWAGSFGVPGHNPFDEIWRGLGGDREGLVWGGNNPESLRGYRVVKAPVGDAVGFDISESAGALLSIQSFQSAAAYGGSTYTRHFVLEGAANRNWTAGAGPTFSGDNFRAYIRAFRWNQRPVVLSDWRIYKEPRTYTGATPLATHFSLQRMSDPDDTNEPGINDMLANWPLDDAEAQSSLRETVEGNDAHRVPFANSTTDQGSRGISERLLSGDGEAFVLDLSENSSFTSEFRRALEDGKSGFSIELTMRLPEALYGIPVKTLDTGAPATDRYAAKFAPRLISWEPKDAVNAGFKVKPNPLLEFGHKVELTGVAAGVATAWQSPFAEALGFDVKYSTDSDQEESQVRTPLAMEAWEDVAGTPTNRYGDGTWIGETITVQVGIEPTDTPELFTAYVAYSPKRVVFPESGDAPGSEFAYFQSITIDRRSLERSVICIGGAWSARGLSALEHSARVLVDEVRVFGASTPGQLPATSGEETEKGLGKIGGGQALPQNELGAGDLLLDLPPLETQNGLTAMLAPAGRVLDTSDPEDAANAIARTFLMIEGEVDRFSRNETLPVESARFYFVATSTGSQLDLASPYSGPSRISAAGKGFRAIGYTAFGDDTEDVSIPTGRGAAFEALTSDVQNAAISPKQHANLAPTGGDWKLRTYSGFPSGEGTHVAPTWVRGSKAGNRNPILGVHSLGSRKFAVAQGALFEVDDRWRFDGPTPSLTKSLAFLSKIDPESSVPLPLAKDRLLIEGRNDSDGPNSNVDLIALDSLVFNSDGPPTAEFQPVFDFWVKLSEYTRYQTVVALTKQNGDVQYWIRFDRGIPELVIGSTDNAAGRTEPPIDGLYVSRAERRIPLDKWVHVRWHVPFITSDAGFPILKVQGRLVTTNVNAIGATATAGQWIPAASIASDPTTFRTQLSFGAIPHMESVESQPFRFTVPVDIANKPEPSPRLMGWLHSLGGQLASCVISNYPTAGGTVDTAATFNPKTVAYPGGTDLTARYMFLHDEQERYGVGHQIFEAVTGKYHKLESHGLISLAHDLGRSATRPDFVNYEGDVYVANGTRVRVVDGDRVFKAGLLAPQEAPDFDVIRQPLWKLNKSNAASDPNNGPVGQLDTQDNATQELVYHYSNPGSSYISQPFDGSMQWGPDKYFAFKCYVRMRSTAGRIPLYSSRGSLRSGGPFVEIREGHLVVGWYDTSLKREVSIQTSKAVIRAGELVQIHVRKWFPRGGVPSGNSAQMSDQGSNWQNTLFEDCRGTGANAIARDMLLVRTFPRAAQGALFDDWRGFDAKAAIEYPIGGGTLQDWANKGGSARACVSFTSEDKPPTLHVGADVYTISGVVGDYVPSTAIGDLISLPAGAFPLDYVGMLCQLTQGPRQGQVFRIVEVRNAGLEPRSLVVVDESDASPVFITAVDLAIGGTRLVIGTGVNLVKSEDFDASLSPDTSEFAIELFGSSLAGDPISGIARFDGEAWCPAYVMADGNQYLASGVAHGHPDIFEDAAAALTGPTPRIVSGAEIGTDWYGRTEVAPPVTQDDLPYAGRASGELEVDNQFAHTAIDTRLYEFASPAVPVAPSSSQPGGSTLEISKRSTSTAVVAVTWGDIFQDIVGERRLVMTFFDIDNVNVESGPSPILRLSPASEEPNNPSRGLTILLNNLPAPIDDNRNIGRRFYLSVSGGLTMFPIGDLLDEDATSFPLRVDELVIAGAPLDETLSAPPMASVLGVHEGRMYFGNLKNQPDGIAFSRNGVPEVLTNDATSPSIFPLQAGLSEEVTGLVSHGGEMIATKRSAIIGLRFVGAGPIQRTITEGDGNLSPQCIVDLEDRVYMCSDRGPFILVLDQVGRASPFYIGKNVNELFTSEADPSELGSMSAALNRSRSQVIYSFKGAGRLWSDRRIAVEFDHPLSGPAQTNELVAGHRFGLFSGPNVTALASAPTDRDCPCSVIAGTEEGFVVWLDRSETRTLMMGPDPRAFGDFTLTHESVGNYEKPVLDDGVVDYGLEGPRGAVLRWLDRTDPANPIEKEAVVIGSYPWGANPRLVLWGPDGTFEAPNFPDGSVLPNKSGTPDGFSDVTLGAMLAWWRSPWIDQGAADLDKEGLFLNVTHAPEPSGVAKIDLYGDLEAAKRDSSDMDLTDPYQEIGLQDCLGKVRALSFRLRLETPAVDVGFELLDYVVRSKVTDNE